MTRPVSDIAFTTAVKAAQQKRGSRNGYANMEQRGGWQDVVTPDLAEFIAERDSIYVGTASDNGQPYIRTAAARQVFSRCWTSIRSRLPTWRATPSTSRSAI